MTLDYKAIASENASALTQLREALPQAMHGFTQLAEAATTEAALEQKTKNLIALALSLLTRSKPCMVFHLQHLLKDDALRYEELVEVIELAAYIGGGPVMIFAAQALQAFKQLTAKEIDVA